MDSLCVCLKLSSAQHVCNTHHCPSFARDAPSLCASIDTDGEARDPAGAPFFCAPHTKPPSDPRRPRMHSNAFGDTFTNVIPAGGRPEKGADHFLDLRSRLERSSLFRLARRCVPSCEKRARGTGQILRNARVPPPRCAGPATISSQPLPATAATLSQPALPWTNYQQNTRYQPCACRA